MEVMQFSPCIGPPSEQAHIRLTVVEAELCCGQTQLDPPICAAQRWVCCANIHFFEIPATVNR